MRPRWIGARRFSSPWRIMTGNSAASATRRIVPRSGATSRASAAMSASGPTPSAISSTRARVSRASSAGSGCWSTKPSVTSTMMRRCAAADSSCATAASSAGAMRVPPFGWAGQGRATASRNACAPCRGSRVCGSASNATSAAESRSVSIVAVSITARCARRKRSTPADVAPMLPDLSTTNTSAVASPRPEGRDSTGSRDSSLESPYEPAAKDCAPPSTSSPVPASRTALWSAAQVAGRAADAGTSSSTTAAYRSRLPAFASRPDRVTLSSVHPPSCRLRARTDGPAATKRISAGAATSIATASRQASTMFEELSSRSVASRTSVPADTARTGSDTDPGVPGAMRAATGSARSSREDSSTSIGRVTLPKICTEIGISCPGLASPAARTPEMWGDCAPGSTVLQSSGTPASAANCRARRVSPLVAFPSETMTMAARDVVDLRFKARSIAASMLVD